MMNGLFCLGVFITVGVVTTIALLRSPTATVDTPEVDR